MRRGGPLHLFARWELIRRRLRRTRRLVLMLDFDGTLAPLRARRSQARLGSGVRRLLESFARRPNTAVYLISGRRLADLRRHARIAGARFLGLHGWESARGLPPPSRAYRMIRKLKRRLAPRLRNLRGISSRTKVWGSASITGLRRPTPPRSREPPCGRRSAASMAACASLMGRKSGRSYLARTRERERL